jgi:hypothetical protein
MTTFWPVEVLLTTHGSGVWAFTWGEEVLRFELSPHQGGTRPVGNRGISEPCGRRIGGRGALRIPLALSASTPASTGPETLAEREDDGERGDRRRPVVGGAGDCGDHGQERGAAFPSPGRDREPRS